MLRKCAVATLLLSAVVAGFLISQPFPTSAGLDGPLATAASAPRLAVGVRPVVFRRPAGNVTLGTVGISDAFVSVFALNADGTWAGLPNANGAPSFICYSLNPPANNTFGEWRFDPRIPAVNLYGLDGAPLATLNGLSPRAPAPQAGAISGWHCGPAPGWTFLP
jgi:hypothetical protein